MSFLFIGHCAIPCSSGILYIGGMLESEITTSEVIHLNLFGMFQEKDFAENNSKNSKCSVIEEESVALSSLVLSSFTPTLSNSTSTSSSTRVPDNERSVPNNESPLLINTHTDVHTHTHTVNDVHTQTHSQSPTQITLVPTTPLSKLHVDTHIHIHTSAHTDTHTVARTCTDNHHSAVPSVGVQKWDFLLSSDSTPLGLKDDDDFYRRLSNLNNMNQKRIKIENLKKNSFTRQYSLKEE